MSDPVSRLNAALQGRYRVERHLGEGGMATVWLAEDLRHSRSVALKVLREELAEVVGADRFLSEIRTTANLQHPHILPLFDSGNADGLLFYVMPYVEGETLRDQLDRDERLSVDDAIRITSALAGALQHAHDAGVIHRDVKPANIMISGGLPILSDFGIATAVASSAGGNVDPVTGSDGTPLYASPEQAGADQDVDARTDQYALACVLYETLTGRLPHEASTTEALVAKRLTESPARARDLRPATPAAVDEAILRALAVNRDDRFATAAEFGMAISAAASGGTPLAVRESAPAFATATTRMVGREKELQELESRLADAKEGQGSLVLIGGDAGVGKTRLVQELMQEAERGDCLGLVGRAYEPEGMPPFTPFIEQLEHTSRVIPAERFRAVLADAAPDIARMVPSIRRQFPDIGPGIDLPPDQYRHHLFHRYREVVARAASVRPVVVLFDDMHQADEGSLLLLEFLTQTVHTMPILALVVYREVEDEASGPFAASLERLSKVHSVHRMELAPLSRDEVAAQLESLAGSAPPSDLVGILFEQTEGNPYFVEEIFQHLDGSARLRTADGEWRTDLHADELELPKSVRRLVERRLESVSDDGTKALRAAAVMGQRFEVAVIEATDTLDPDDLLDALEEAESAQLIRSLPSRRSPAYEFTHAVIRQVLLGGLSIPRSQRIHLKIADAIEAVFGRRVNDRASDMARHLYNAGIGADPDRTVHFLQLAGDQALAGSGFEEALAQYDRALSLEEDLPEEARPALLEGRMNAFDGMGDWAQLVETGRAAMEACRQAGDPHGLARVGRVVTYRLSWMAKYPEAAQVGGSALVEGPEAAGPDRAALRCQLGVTRDLLGDPEARAMIEEGLEEAKASGDEAAILKATLMLTIFNYHHSRYGDAAAAMADAWERLQDSTAQATRADFLWLRCLVLPKLGRLDDATASIAEARRIGRERNEIGALLCASFGEIAATGMRTADGRKTEQLGRTLAESFAAAGPWAKGGLTQAGLGKLWQGYPKDAGELMHIDGDPAEETRLWGTMALAWRFRTAAYGGMPQAMQLYENAKPNLFRVGQRAFPGDGFGLHAVIEGLAVLDELELAAEWYEHALASLELGILGNWDILWSCTTGIAASAAERWDEAEEHFRTAIEQAEIGPHLMGAIHARYWWGWSLLKRGRRRDRGRATELLQEAIEGYERVDAPLFRKIAKDLLG